MQQRKYTITILLITSSIVLLLVLQGFWLVNSYEKVNLDLRRETNMLFRNTIFVMRDSFISRNIQSIPTDSTITDRGEGNGKDILGFAGKEPGNRKDDDIQVFITSTSRHGDSIPNTILHPIVKRIQDEHHHGKNRFFIRLGSDSLPIDSITSHFNKTLSAENIQLTFKVKHAPIPPPPFERGRHHKGFFTSFDRDTSMGQEIHPFNQIFETEWVHYNPINRYSATISEFRPILVKQIMPQILFSVFLTSITIVSFIFLYKSLRSQQRLMELKNEFISNMTHELKTPIATVSVALEALKDFKAIEDPKRTEEYLTMAQHELNRLTILTDNVLNTSLFEENQINFIHESVNMDQIIQQVLDSMKLVLEKNKASVRFLKEGNNFSTYGSTIHLTNVVYNLLDNAIKYSEADPEIEIKLTDMGEGIKLNVKDQGIGIASEYKEKVFEKFFRVPTGNIHTIKGYGLGLSYVNSVILQHGGKINLNSHPGKGSEIIISLPHKKNSSLL